MRCRAQRQGCRSAALGPSHPCPCPPGSPPWHSVSQQVHCLHAVLVWQADRVGSHDAHVDAHLVGPGRGREWEGAVRSVQGKGSRRGTRRAHAAARGPRTPARTWFSVPSAPRMEVGAISATYRGTSTEAAPEPRPTKKRPASMAARRPAVAHSAVPASRGRLLRMVATLQGQIGGRAVRGVRHVWLRSKPTRCPPGPPSCLQHPPWPQPVSDAPRRQRAERGAHKQHRHQRRALLPGSQVHLHVRLAGVEYAQVVACGGGTMGGMSGGGAGGSGSGGDDSPNWMLPSRAAAVAPHSISG